MKKKKGDILYATSRLDIEKTKAYLNRFPDYQREYELRNFIRCDFEVVMRKFIKSAIKRVGLK